MKREICQYLLAAMAADAAYIACDNAQEYDLLANFGRTAAAAGRLSDLCEDESTLMSHNFRKIRGFLRRNGFGDDQWYRNALECVLQNKPIELDEVGRDRKAAYDEKFREYYGKRPPNLDDY